MDIDDILRSVDPSHGAVPQATRDLQALTRAWVAERSAPELLELVLLSFTCHGHSTPSQSLVLKILVIS